MGVTLVGSSGEMFLHFFIHFFLKNNLSLKKGNKPQEVVFDPLWTPHQVLLTRPSNFSMWPWKTWPLDYLSLTGTFWMRLFILANSNIVLPCLREAFTGRLKEKKLSHDCRLQKKLRRDFLYMITLSVPHPLYSIPPGSHLSLRLKVVSQRGIPAWLRECWP